jgi:hypothetical protein
MPWWKPGTQMPAELENMDPQDLLNAVNKSKEVDTLRSELATATGKLSEVDAVKARLAELEANTPKPPTDPGPRRPLSVLEDEDGAFNERLAPLAGAMYTAQAQNARFIAKSQLGPLDRKIWEKFEDEIDTVMKTVALQYQAMASTWNNALTTIKGRHFDELQKMASDKTDFFAEEAGSGGRGGPQGPVLDELNDEDKRLAKRMGISEADYLASKKDMVIRG